MRVRDALAELPLEHCQILGVGEDDAARIAYLDADALAIMVRGVDHLFRLDLFGPKPEGSGEAFTILTNEPDPDVAPIHNR